MSRRVLLDANLLIGALDGEPGNAQHAQARQRLEDLLQDPEVTLAISPLIRYEVMRGVRRVSADQLREILNDFHEFDVRACDAERAAQLFQQARQQGRALDKRSFDLFHCVCAELNGLELDSQDGDIPKIQELIRAS
ncbi:type II toxin-antitoxin system VapC family toxin [Vandammella animalimorsus]|uniref:PIN domain-containing protein n=1 Tax=Vandammella animalimorsus TaxID=2029117 RepID=A0A2A2ATL3_9BURK|nr:PIN domain-containing protein [Vandammella animalimorsus]PAT41071.1 PIN domain-containing protein [Vandammella animalimorsus]